MEEVWAVYLCLFLFVIVLILLRKKPDDDIVKEKEKSSSYSTSSSAYTSGSLGKRLECTEEELEASLRRLSGVLFATDAHKREPHPEHKSSSQQKKASQHTPQEHLVNEIEQAVQEAVDTDVRVRKRPQPPQQTLPDVHL